jgi:hypothetical protein
MYMTRTGKPGQDRHNRTGKILKEKQGMQNRTDRTGQENRTGRKGRP